MTVDSGQSLPSGTLPVEDALPDILHALEHGNAAVLVAPPGAGKTTGVPPALLEAPWLTGRKILLLEPRRLAARAAAERMAELRGERVGGTVGLRARLDTRVGPKTRIEVVTEGVFTRLILDDPALEGVGLVIFDEFHERSLDADLGLALALDAQTGLRDDLRLLVMSATLDGARVAALLGDAPVIQSEGRAFGVDTRYLGRPNDRSGPQGLVGAVCRATQRAIAEETGSLLVFLPGQSEIRRAAEFLRESNPDPRVDIVELHGGLDGRTQRSAIEPAPRDRRKVVLATAIAQTSITIEGVRVVVDSGLERLPRYDPAAGVTRLETVRVSRATADQRRGRAGRTEPGVCYRLWNEPETQGLQPFTAPEMLSADLSSLVLDCAAWGVTAPETLAWLDPPPKGALAAARRELEGLGALEVDGRLSDLGRRLRALPVAPRLAAMMLAGASRGAATKAAQIAAVLSERGAGGLSADLDDRLAGLGRDRSPRAEGLRRLADGWARLSGEHAEPQPAGDKRSGEVSTASLLFLAFPDRVARARGPRGTFLMANGRAGIVDAASPLAGCDWLVVAEMSGIAAGARILLAARLGEAELEAMAGDRMESGIETLFDPQSASLRARATRRLGAIVLTSEPRPVKPDEAGAETLALGIAGLGIARLPWSRRQLQLRDRVGFVRRSLPDDERGDWPDLSDSALARTVSTWLAPFIVGVMRLADIDADRLGNALDAMLPWHLKQRLETDAPTHFEAPTGNRFAIDYEGDGAPIVACRVQELFGLKQHPTIAGGRLALTLHLLSPAGHPIQITRDLTGFWAGSWRDVRSEMKGRYPKHVWPEDPANAEPTARAKPRGT